MTLLLLTAGPLSAAAHPPDPPAPGPAHWDRRYTAALPAQRFAVRLESQVFTVSLPAQRFEVKA